MKKLGLAASLLALLMVGCSNVSTPRTSLSAPPDVAVSVFDAPEQEGAEVLATPEEVRLAEAHLQALALVPTAPQSNVARVRPDGTLLINGQATFPMGFYHVSWAGNAARRMRDLHAIADLGFNTMNATMFDAEGDIEGYRALLDAAQARGMRLFVEDFNSRSIEAFKSHPALLGWMIADDCNHLVTPEELQRRHDAVKAQDPDHLTYTSMAISFANSHLDYFGRADAIGNQSYPIDGGDDISVVYPTMKTLVSQSALTGTLPIANLQSFHWEGGRYPTPLELTNMTNQALAAGVKGILYYTYLDTTNDLTNRTALKAELKRLSGEMSLLTPVLLDGQRTALKLEASGGQGLAHLWELGGHRYLQVINLSTSRALKVKVTLPADAGLLRPVFEGRPTGLSVMGGTVTGTVGKLSVHWYELQ